MPEGPEVWILSNAINQYYNEEMKTRSIGKHLIVNDINEDWSFGLTGKVSIDDTDILTKINSGWLYGDQISITDNAKKLGIDWLTSNKEDLEQEVNNWITSKKKLATLLLDQSKICGIGVAWGSEILFKTNLRPDFRACDQNLTNLVDTMIEVREIIKKVYENGLTNITKTEKNCKEFINDWFSNLYEIREMNIYKKGSQVKIQGRNWWV
jgi:formamidopyrimidine-DNA glycosylase